MKPLTPSGLQSFWGTFWAPHDVPQFPTPFLPCGPNSFSKSPIKCLQTVSHPFPCVSNRDSSVATRSTSVSQSYGTVTKPFLPVTQPFHICYEPPNTGCDPFRIRCELFRVRSTTDTKPYRSRSELFHILDLPMRNRYTSVTNRFTSVTQLRHIRTVLHPPPKPFRIFRQP